MPDSNNATAPKKDDEGLLSKAWNFAKSAAGAVGNNISNQLGSNLGSNSDDSKDEQKQGAVQEENSPKKNQEVETDNKKGKDPMVELMEDLGQMVSNINNAMYGWAYNKMEAGASFVVDKSVSGVKAAGGYAMDKAKEAGSNLIDKVSEQFNNKSTENSASMSAMNTDSPKPSPSAGIDDLSSSGVPSTPQPKTDSPQSDKDQSLSLN